MKPSQRTARSLVILGFAIGLAGCGGDKDFLQPSSAGGKIVALLEGRRDSCFEGELHHFSGTRAIPNVQSNGGCDSSVTTFTRDHGVYRESPLSSFTDEPEDTLEIELLARRELPLSLWLVDPPFTGAWPGIAAFCGSTAGLGLCGSVDSLRRAAYTLLRDNGVGVSLVSQLKKTDLDSVGGTCSKAKEVDLPNDPAAYDADAINAYFVPSDAYASSWNCGLSVLKDPKVIFVAMGTASDSTLLHELGHALSLSHLNAAGSLVDASNVMCFGTPCGDLSNRRRLGIGQLFRANLNDHSSLNLLGLSTWQTSCCPDSLEYPPCQVANLNVSCPDPELSNPLQP